MTNSNVCMAVRENNGRFKMRFIDNDSRHDIDNLKCIKSIVLQQNEGLRD